MAVFERPDSPFYWLRLDGHKDPLGKPLRERTHILKDAATALQRKENRALAERRYHERMTELARGQFDPQKKPTIGFTDFAAWFEIHKLPKRRGHEREAFTLPRLVAHFGPLPLTALDRAAVEEYATARLTTPTTITATARAKARTMQAGPATVNREVDLLKAVMQAAVPRYLDASPLYGMKRLTVRTPKRRLMTEAEERRLLEVMDLDDKALFLLGLDSLVRLGDLLDVKRSDVKRSSVWVADPKAGGGFEVPLSARTREAIDAAAGWRPQRGRLTPAQRDEIRAQVARAGGGPTYVELASNYGVSEAAIRKIAARRVVDEPASDYLFARRRAGRTEASRRSVIRGMLSRYCRLAGIPSGRARDGLTFHWSTRRTGATRMLTRGIDPGTVQKVGRWKDPTVVLGIYHELLDDRAQAAVESVGTDPRTSRARDPQET